jgi:hypothetical protein
MLSLKIALNLLHSKTKNTYLTWVHDRVVRYNKMSVDVDAATRIGMLQSIMTAAGRYLTSKPPQPDRHNRGMSKNQERWDALTNLLEQIGPEAQRLGVRMLSGPADWRRIGETDNHNVQVRSYWLEFLDPLHRPGFKLTRSYAAWLKDATAIQLKQSFWEYLRGGKSPQDAANDAKALGLVEYPSSDYQMSLSKFEVWVDDKGVLRELDGGAEFLSKNHTTVVSGDGWAIWVCSPTGRMYAGSHIEAKFYHASFLGGRPVMAAGELVTDDGGVIKVITAKSGHYMPSPDDLRRFVSKFTNIPSSAVIRPDMLDKRAAKDAVTGEYVGAPQFFTVGEFRMHGMTARKLDQQAVLFALPSWARTPKAMEELGKLPKRVVPQPVQQQRVSPPPRPPKTSTGVQDKIAKFEGRG